MFPDVVLSDRTYADQDRCWGLTIRLAELCRLCGVAADYIFPWVSVCCTVPFLGFLEPLERQGAARRDLRSRRDGTWRHDPPGGVPACMITIA